MTDKTVLARMANDVPPRSKPSNYPAPFAARVAGRIKRQLGDAFGLTNFGVNLTTLPPGGESALLHMHSKQDEFIYVLEGTATLRTPDGEVALSPGICAGFPANGIAHHIVNRSDAPFTYLEIGDRRPGDQGSYPEDDLLASMGPDGKWQFTNKAGKPYS